MDAIKLLATLGIPSAIVAMVIISFIFKDKFEKLTRLSLLIAIILAAVLGIIQIVVWIGGKDVRLSYSPKEFYALSHVGEPTELRVTVEKSGRKIAADTIAALDLVSFKSRVLTLDTTATEKFAVLYNSYQQGTLNYDELKDNGWRPAYDVGEEESKPRYWFTHKVYVGQTSQLGRTSDSGMLEISFTDIRDGKAIVKLSLQGSGQPKPREVAIENKKIGAQDFQDVPTFYIAVREADFSTEERWAAFSVFQYRGY